MKLSVYTLLFALVFCMGCGNDDDDGGGNPPPPPPVLGVNFELDEVPYANLSDYRFFTGELADLAPNEGVLAYEPISTLFTDYAKKSRFIWMPEGTSASMVDDHQVLDFPDGTVMIKSFYYDNVQPDNNRRIIETRLIYKVAGEWKFADYTWNEGQTEATYDLAGSFTPVEFVDDNGTTRSVNYRIPSEVECLTCHKKNELAIPIGPKPQNLNAEFAYADGNMNQLSKWFQAGYLDSAPNVNDIVTVGKWKDETVDLNLRVRSYLDINCAHCHRDGSHCDYRSMRFGFGESITPASLGICVEPDEFIGSSLTNIVTPGRKEKSALHYRISSNADMVRMPLLGRSITHDEGVAMIGEWIDSLTDICD